MRRSKHSHRQRREHDRRGTPRSRRPRPDLFECDEHRDQRHPGEAHHAQREQRGHQRPRAPDAPAATAHAHQPVRRTAPARNAVRNLNLAPAPRQAGVLERSELIERRRARSRRPTATARRGARPDRAGEQALAQLEQPVRHHARGGPREQVADANSSQRLGPRRPRAPRYPARVGSERGQHHRGHHHHPRAP